MSKWKGGILFWQMAYKTPSAYVDDNVFFKATAKTLKPKFSARLRKSRLKHLTQQRQMPGYISC